MSHPDTPTIEPHESHPSQGHIPLDAVWVYGGFFILCLFELLAILVLNDFKFIYTMDDPYIHLAVAEEMMRGHYGVNGSEFCAPCSSPIWPFLIAPLARTPVGDLFPLVLNLVFGFLTCLVVLRGLRRAFPDDGSQSARAAMASVILLGCNVVGLVFTGMEHNLQVLAAVLLVDGMLRFSATGKVGKWLVLAAVAGPLVRYENLALTAAACGLLFLKDRKALAFGVGCAAVAGLAAFSGFLALLGLPLMPSSIIAKSHLTTGGSRLGGIADAIGQTFTGNRGVLLLLMVTALGWLSVRRGSEKTKHAALCLAGAGVLHVCFGAYGWYNRYECYVFASLLYAIFVLAGGFASGLVRRWTGGEILVTAVLGLVISYPYVAGMFTVPLAANNIYEQQFQMHRFVTGWWKKPVAVNDLGWVTYRNDAYVLDLWGLASHDALNFRMAKKDPSWMTRVAEKHDAELAIVYESWVPGRQIGWIKVGQLHLSRERVTPASPVVAFFATSPSAVDEIDRQLVDFRKTLPPGVVLEARSDREKKTPRAGG
ncbi:hypothetical protein JIN84_06645 [Luteolibacter yonseiensis]|uniref:Uncharacterized protein n=1 Tax=Luteolibacter yonseiensis TaxID=1144680 RepID=A0A934QYY6_9BACT|nr:hypothetical protein [Luteolibacter yonseiensis]MBK1815283.1 hypothetical protein [Luteolibacter yonseiensis]